MRPWNVFNENQRERAYQAIYPGQMIKSARVQIAYIPDVDMESVGSHLSLCHISILKISISMIRGRKCGDMRSSHHKNVAEWYQNSSACSCVSDDEVERIQWQRQRRTPGQKLDHQSQVSVRARSSARRRKCLVLGDMLIGLARNWYDQLSRSTRHKRKRLLEYL